MSGGCLHFVKLSGLKRYATLSFRGEGGELYVQPSQEVHLWTRQSAWERSH